MSSIVFYKSHACSGCRWVGDLPYLCWMTELLTLWRKLISVISLIWSLLRACDHAVDEGKECHNFTFKLDSLFTTTDWNSIRITAAMAPFQRWRSRPNRQSQHSWIGLSASLPLNATSHTSHPTSMAPPVSDECTWGSMWSFQAVTCWATYNFMSLNDNK